MKLRIVPARMGLTWLGNGLRASIRQPMGFLGLWGLVVCGAIITVEILLQLGLAALGPLLLVSCMPMMWMGFMLATRRVVADQKITPGVLIEPLRNLPPEQKWMWVKLGAAYLLATMVAIGLADILGPGSDTMAEALKNSKEASEVLGNADVQAALLWQFALTIPVSLVFWHTPALVYWAKLPLSKALFFSAVASWRNLGAFIMFGLAWAAMVLGLIAVNGLLMVLINEPMLVNILVTMSAMWMAAAFYASLYFSVIDCFEPYKTTDSSVA